MYLSILIFPLLGSISAGFLGRKIGVTGAHIITCTCLIISSILVTVAFYEVGICGSPVTIYLFHWIDSEFMSISWEFLFDQLTVSLSLAVIYCSTLIHIYSVDYLSSDPAKCYGKTFIGYKLSNSGEPLKLRVPSYSRKAISGQNNYLGTVTSPKIDEKKMGNRGSKSVLVTSTVKEQRVDGSWCIAKYNPMHLRCTLMGFERNYPIKIPSKQLNFKYFSTFNYLSNVNPWFWTGLIDAEGSFGITILINKTRKLGWRVESRFQMGLHKRDLSLLLQLQQFLGGIGSIHINNTLNKVNYSINSNKDLTNLIINLEKYTLLTQKKSRFYFV